MKPYEDCKIRGPYLRKDGRLHLVIFDTNNRKTTLSYPKYLMEIKLNRYLNKDETVHHKDKNPLNNNIENLEILLRSDHTRKHSLKYINNIEVICTYCGKKIILTPKQQRSRMQNRNRNKGGIFCNKSCSGKYGKLIQMKNKTAV